MSVIIYEKTDRIPLKIGDVKLEFAPLTFKEKMIIGTTMKMVDGKEVRDHVQMGYLVIKYGVRNLSGVKTAYDKEYKLKFEEDGSLTDSSVEAIYQLACIPKIVAVCLELGLNVIKEHKIEGVEIDLKNTYSILKKTKSRS